jgi:membrane fusion protein (multidrug efflux system)
MVRARISDASHAPSPGASVRVRISAGPSTEAVAVPASALRKGPAGDHVFVLENDDVGNPRAHLRPVTVAALSGDEAIIETGLAAGEQVAAAGSFKLRESVLVALANSPVTSVGAQL